MWKDLTIFALIMNIRKTLTILLLTVCLYGKAYNDYRNAKVDSLEALLKSANPPKGDDLLRAYDELMRGWLPFDGAKAVDYGKKALALSYKRNGLRVRQDILRRFGLMHYAREEFDEALRYFNWALAIVDSMSHDKRYTQENIDDCYSCLYGAIGNVYNLQDKHNLAIHYYQLALPIFEKYNWLESQTILYHNIGELYLTMGNLQEAERNYQMALKKSEASGDSLMMALGRKGLIKIYMDQDDYEKARRTAEKCYAYYHAHRSEEKEDYPVVLASMVRLNLMKGHENLPLAKTYAKKALSLADSLRFENQSDVYAACAELAMAEHQWQQALNYALHTIHPDSLATSADASCYRLLAEIYTQLGQKDKACLYINKMYEVLNRYATDHYQSGLSQMQVLYDTEKKEAQIAALDKERTLYRWLLLAAGFAIVALVAGCILIVIMHQRKKALLAAKVALKTESKERHILARDLHDSLGGMLSLLRLKLETKEDGAMHLLDDTIVELRRVSHHLMPEELLRSGLTSALRDFSISIPGARFQSTGQADMSKEQELVLYRCAYELVNNALKHSKASHIDIQLMMEQKQATLTVSDNGQGLPQTSHQGMGLQNIRERIEPYHGELRIITNEGQGTEINVTLPL